MQLTFSPALGEAVPLVVRPRKPDASQDVLFKATFDSFASYEHAKLHGARVEMWTDLPVEGRARGEWGAVPFALQGPSGQDYGEARSVLSLASPADEDVACDGEEFAVYAKLTLRLGGYRKGHHFSFTYRLIHATGEVRWLGAFGQNGTLVVDRKSLPEALGVTLGEGWQIQEDGVAIFEGGPAHAQEVGQLLDSSAWSSWAIGRDSWPVFSPAREAKPSAALVLISHPRGHAIVPIPPVVVSASSGASVSIDAQGHIVYSSNNDGVDLALRVIDDTTLVVLTNCDIPIRLLGSGTNPVSASMVACHAPGTALPLSVLVLPSKNGCTTQEVPLDIDALAPTTLDGVPRTFVVTTATRQDCRVASEGGQIAVRVGSFGGVALVAPLYDLATLEGVSTSSWKVSMLQHHTNVSITTVDEEVDVVSQRLLPTPPPSPPIVMRAAQRPPHLVLPSFTEASEVLSSMHSSALSSTVSTPAAAPNSVPPASTTCGRPLTPYSMTHPRADVDELAVMRMRSIYPLSSYARMALATFAWIWRVILQRFAFLWLGIAGVQVSDSGAEGDESASASNTAEPELHEDQQLNDDEGESADEEQKTTGVIPVDTPTPTAVDEAVATPIWQPEPKLPIATSKGIRTLPAMQFDVSSHDGKIALLVQAPEEAPSVSDRMRFVMNGKSVLDPSITAKHHGYHLVHLDAPIDRGSTLTVVSV